MDVAEVDLAVGGRYKVACVASFMQIRAWVREVRTNLEVTQRAEVGMTCSPRTGPPNMGLRVAMCGEEESCGGAGSARSRSSPS